VSYTYASFAQALAIEMAVPNNNPGDPQFTAILPTLIDQAEQRCYRDLDLLYATSSQTLAMTAGSSLVDFSKLAPQLVILEDVNLVIPPGGGGAVPAVSIIAVGDSPPASPTNGTLWFSTTDAQLYIWYNDGTSVQWVVAVNQVATFLLSSTGSAPPTSPVNGALWFSGSDAQLYMWYNDGTSAQWISIVNQGANGTGGVGTGGMSSPSIAIVSDTPPSLVNGALWFSTTDAALYVGYNDGSSSQWVVAVNQGTSNAGTGPGPLPPPGDEGERVPVYPVSRQWLRMVFGQSATKGPPQYYAMQTDRSLVVGPFPDQPYKLELTGKYRPTPLYLDPSQTTVLAQLVPDLFLAAAMVAATGYQHSWSAMSDDPRSALSWEGNYNTLLQSAQAEEMRKKLHSWMQMTAERPPPPTVPGTPGPT
jgi:hypothetical protein